MAATAVEKELSVAVAAMAVEKESVAAATAVAMVVEGGCDCCLLYRIYYFIVLKAKIDPLLQHICR